MFLRTHAARGNETNRFSATYTLSDFPLLIGEILRRSERRSRSEEHTSELQSQSNLVCRLLLEKKKKHIYRVFNTQLTHGVNEPFIHLLNSSTTTAPPFRYTSHPPALSLCHFHSDDSRTSSRAF